MLMCVSHKHILGYDRSAGQPVISDVDGRPTKRELTVPSIVVEIKSDQTVWLKIHLYVTVQRITVADGPDTHGVLNQHPLKPDYYEIGITDTPGASSVFEDSYGFVVDFNAIPGQGVFAIFDGHGNKLAAEWAGGEFHKHLLHSISENPNALIEDVLKDMFESMDHALSLRSANSGNWAASGTTAAIAFLRLWDVISDKEAVDRIQHIEDQQIASKSLVDLAMERGNRDNVTVMVGRNDHDFKKGTNGVPSSKVEEEQKRGVPFITHTIIMTLTKVQNSEADSQELPAEEDKETLKSPQTRVPYTLKSLLSPPRRHKEKDNTNNSVHSEDKVESPTSKATLVEDSNGPDIPVASTSTSDSQNGVEFANIGEENTWNLNNSMAYYNAYSGAMPPDIQDWNVYYYHWSQYYASSAHTNSSTSPPEHFHLNDDGGTQLDRTSIRKPSRDMVPDWGKRKADPEGEDDPPSKRANQSARKSCFVSASVREKNKKRLLSELEREKESSSEPSIAGPSRMNSEELQSSPTKQTSLPRKSSWTESISDAAENSIDLPRARRKPYARTLKFEEVKDERDTLEESLQDRPLLTSMIQTPLSQETPEPTPEPTTDQPRKKGRKPSAKTRKFQELKREREMLIESMKAHAQQEEEMRRNKRVR
ncbi:hypothetical protein H0H92_003627 [Tricholoma furcatifolium]|nr:hypothetical protein H0H92_003627 [Tricholoma furcatifolium]